MAPRSVERADKLLRGMGMNIDNGSWYLEGFVGYRDAKNIWLVDKVQG